MRKRWLVLGLAVCFCILALNSGISKEEQETRDDFYEEIELFTDCISIIRAEYVDEVKHKDLIYGSLRGMLVSLDPYSQFMDPDTYKEIKVETEGEFGGLGIEITIKDGLLTIVTPIDGTPAYHAGLKAQDKIVKIDGELTRDITLMEAVRKLRGKPGTQVTVTIMRERARKLLDFTITRDIIKIESIKQAKIIEDNIGYIRLVEFQEKTLGDLESALENLKNQGMQGLVLDLRNNPGGLLDVAVEVADKFLEPDRMIVSTQGRIRSQNLEFKSHAKNAHTDYPLVILINGGSASGSEIVAGAIQDHQRGLLLGTKTFGKGSVQTVIPLRDGSAIRLTTSKYYTPSGRSIHGEGIVPDVVVEFEEEEPREEPNDKSAKVFDKIENGEAIEEEEIYDNQLVRAVDLLKGIKIYQNRKTE